MNTSRLLPILLASAVVVSCGVSADVVAPNCQLAPSAPLPTAMSAGTQAAPAISVSCLGRDAGVVRWSSSDAAVAAIDSLTGVITARAVGDATITARVSGISGNSVQWDLSVFSAPCGAVGPTVTPATFTLTVGSSQRMTMTYPACPVGTDTRTNWSSADTMIATVDTTGIVTGRALGTTAITGRSVAMPSVRATAQVNVAPRSGFEVELDVSPTSITLAPGGSAQLTASVRVPPTAPAGTPTGVRYRSSDSCIARVSPSGLVSTGASGDALITVFALLDTLVRTQVVVAIRAGRGAPLSIPSITVGTPPAAADLNALRGPITVTNNVLQVAVHGGGRIELWLAGRLAATTSFAPIPVGTPFVSVVSIFDTALFPNGAQTLEARLIADAAPPLLSGCAGFPAGEVGRVTQSVTLANP